MPTLPVLARALDSEPSPTAAASTSTETFGGKFTLPIDCQVLLRPIPNPHHTSQRSLAFRPASSTPSTYVHTDPTTFNTPDGDFLHTQPSQPPHPPDPQPSHIYTARSASEVASELQLSPLMAVPIIKEIKIKCNHTCGELVLEDQNKDACLTALWELGKWLVNAFEQVGRSAEVDDPWLNDINARDLHEPDAVLTVFVFPNVDGI